MALSAKLINRLEKWMQKILKRDILIRIFSIMFIPLMQISCSSMSDGEKALANFTKKFNQEILTDYGLHLFGSGAAFPVKIEEIILRYQAEYCENIIGARKLAVEITHKMIERMNQDESLLKFLVEAPANLKNVRLTICFKCHNNNKVPGILDSVMVIGMRNKVVYNTENEDQSMLVIPIVNEIFDSQKFHSLAKCPHELFD